MSTPRADRPLPYHRLATLRPAWAAPSRPVLTLATALVVYVILASVLLVGTVLVLALVPGVNAAMGVTSGDPTSPLDVGIALAMGALWWPAALVGVRVGGWRPLGPTWSVASRWRTELLRSTGIWVVVGALGVVAIAAVAGAVVGADGAGSVGGGASFLQLSVVVLLVLVLAPIQAVGLELALRGMVLQAIGTWLRSPVVGILVVAALALIGRELTAAVMLPALAVALSAAVLAWKTGGLELPILLTATATVSALCVSALAAGTGAGAGASAVGAAVSAPGTSAAALASTEVGPASAEAALAGGAAGAIALLILTVVFVVLVSRRDGLRLLEPVGRSSGELPPKPVLI
ncbi:CAAX protease [Brachybacterium sp. FME24]|uniref:CAAX protease n=1 Tax=Brachybacterium sp. FME24 TaxID=2742605 RepID=UPI0018688678|nr:CAAX protease [Brachybacterium sp. FME24]